MRTRKKEAYCEGPSGDNEIALTDGKILPELIVVDLLARP
jgi:hypothetical protein